MANKLATLDLIEEVSSLCILDVKQVCMGRSIRWGSLVLGEVMTAMHGFIDSSLLLRFNFCMSHLYV
jgi:hypothetical protein